MKKQRTKMTIPRARVKISEYPYGRVNKRLKQAAEWINSNNRKIDCSELAYCLPKSIYNKLDTDEFYFLQTQTVERRMWLWERGK